MRHDTMILASLLGLALAGAPASAQVSFDPRALAPLQQKAGASSAAAPAPAASAVGAPAAPSPGAASAAAPPTGVQTGGTPGTAAASTPRRPAAADSGRRSGDRNAPQRSTPAHRAASGTTEAAKPDATKPAASTAAAHGAARPATSPRPTDSQSVTVPKAPPLPVALPPPTLVVPARPPPPPTPVSVLPAAPGQALTIAGGARITFGPGQSDLNPATDAAIKALMHAAPRSDATTFTVAAYAQGTPEDPSTARRLSLARALAVRSVLITEGVASVRIYVKALGPPSAALPQSQDGPPDRVDITVAGGQAPPTPSKPP